MSIDPFELFQKYGVIVVFTAVLALFIVFITNKVLEHGIAGYFADIKERKELAAQVREDLYRMIKFIAHFIDTAVDNGAAAQKRGLQISDLPTYHAEVIRLSNEAHKRLSNNAPQIAKILPNRFGAALGRTAKTYKELALNGKTWINDLLAEKSATPPETKTADELKAELKMLNDAHAALKLNFAESLGLTK